MTHLVIYHGDCGLYVMCVPLEIVETKDAQEVLNAISGGDERFCPYTGNVEKTNLHRVFIDHVEKTMEEWNAKYGIVYSKNEAFTFGTEFN